MEQRVSRLTDYRLALHDNMAGRTPAGREDGTKDGGWEGFVLPLKADDQCEPLMTTIKNLGANTLPLASDLHLSRFKSGRQLKMVLS